MQWVLVEYLLINTTSILKIVVPSLPYTNILYVFPARCRVGWIQYGNDCLFLSSETIPGSLADPKQSCTRLQAKTFPVEKNFCYLQFFAYQSVALIRFQLTNMFSWDRREPLENCTSLVNMYKNGITYSQCQKRIYFVCVQGKAVSLKRYLGSLRKPRQQRQRERR